MKNILYITNIPTPYRDFRFNKLSELLSTQGDRLDVWFMNESEPDRHWYVDSDAMKYRYRIFSKRKISKHLGMWMHFPLRLFAALVTADYDVVVLGGLASPAHFLIALMLPSSKLRILSVESNMDSVKRDSGVAAKVKQYLMRRFDAYQVTGRRAAEFVRFFLGEDEKPVITLPNVINEELYLDSLNESSAEFEYKAEFDKARLEGCRVGFIPARLIEEKGLIPFLTCLEAKDNLYVFIAGEGPLKSNIEDLISSMKLKVVLLGVLSPEGTASCIDHADILILPSKSDPYPLSVIEGLSRAKPLLVSERIGNYCDVIIDGENGFGFVYADDKSCRLAISNMLALNDQQMSAMQGVSLSLFESRFLSNKVLSSYLLSISKILR